MHVILVSDFGHITGGAPKVAIDSAVALAERGVQVTFAYGVNPVDEALHRPSITLADIGLTEVWDVNNPIAAASSAVWNTAAHAGLQAALSQRITPDTVIHIHQWSKALSPATFGAARALGAPVLVTLHDYFPVCPNGAYYHFKRQAPCALKPMSVRCIASDCDSRSRAHKAVRLLRHRRLMRELAKTTDLTFVHVSETARALAEDLSPPHASHLTVWNPVSPLPGDVANPWLNEHVLFAGRLTPEKGVWTLAEAARAVSAPCAFLGDGPAGPELKAAYPEHRYLPWGDKDTVADAIRAARAVVLPSLWNETFGLIVMEALSLGVPVIVSDAVGAGAFIQDGVNGFVTPRGDREALSAALERVMDDTTVRTLSDGALNDAKRQDLSLAGHSAALVDVYQHALSQRSERLNQAEAAEHPA